MAAVPALAPTTAGDFALRFQALLGQHSVLVADMMRGRLRNDEDLAQAANTALTRNTDSMGQFVGDFFGPQQATGFKQEWAEHIKGFFNYSRGLAAHDEGVRRDARTAMTAYEWSLANLFADLSHGRLTRDAAQAAVQTHIEHLLHYADAYASGDYSAAYGAYRDAYAHGHAMGKALAGALLPPDQVTVLEAPTWRLRSELSRMLGEHVALVVDAMRAGVNDSPDFAATGAAMNGNTGDLVTAMATLFGAAPAQSFQKLWADHVDQLMAYTAGVVKKDTAARDTARAKLGTFEQQLASFLDSATGNRLKSAELAKAFLDHDQMLLSQVDAFGSKDYPKAHDLAYSTYQQMTDLATSLADSFGATIAARLPVGGSPTGLGGMAEVVGSR